MTRTQKEKTVADVKADIEKAQAIFLTNLIGVTSNQANTLRRELREAQGKVIVAPNTLLSKAAQGTCAEKMLSGLKGSQAVAFAFDDAAAIAKCLKDAGEDLNPIELRGGLLEGKALSVQEVKELANLPSRDQMLATLLATFMAPVSSFVRVLEAMRSKKEKEENKQIKIKEKE